MCGWRIALRTLASTPTRDGFRMPAEFERHAGCWMLWPERTDIWRAGAKPAQGVFAAVAEAIAASEPVTIGVSAGCWLLGPERTEVWRGGARAAQGLFAAVAEACAASEPVTIGVSAGQF